MACGCATSKDLFLPEPAEVLKAEPMTEMEVFLRFTLDSGRELGHMPGQFVEVSVPGIGEAPISISSSPTLRPGFEMVVRKVGNVTGAIHRLRAGDKVGIRGPYGTHFPVEAAMKGRDLLFVCGGIGLVPVRSAIQYVLHNRRDYGRVIILYGTKSPPERLFLDELRDWANLSDVEYMETVDRGAPGWTGHVGVITTLMPKVEVDPARTVALVCGPPVMYRFVLLELFRMNVGKQNIYVSLERHMKCGVGKCGHCQINGVYVCQDGPVFNYAEVEALREALR